MSTIACVKYSNWADSLEAAGVNNITAIFTEEERRNEREQRLHLSAVEFSGHNL